MKKIMSMVICLVTVLSLTVIPSFAQLSDPIDPSDASSVAVETYVMLAITNKDSWIKNYLEETDDPSLGRVTITLNGVTKMYALKGDKTMAELESAARQQYKSSRVTQHTVEMQHELGIGADTTKAMAALQGFVPLINLGLGAVTVVITLLLAVFTASDVCYISFPVFRNHLEEQMMQGEGAFVKKTTNGGTKLRWVSDEAQYIVAKCNYDSGKSPLVEYLGKRMVSYIAVSVILFILLTGNINVITNLALKIVSYIIDVISGI